MSHSSQNNELQAVFQEIETIKTEFQDSMAVLHARRSRILADLSAALSKRGYEKIRREIE